MAQYPLPGSITPYSSRNDMLDASRMRPIGEARAANTMQVPIKHVVYLQIAELDGGFILTVDHGKYQLCVGADKIETGVRAVLTHLVAKELNK